MKILKFPGNVTTMLVANSFILFGASLSSLFVLLYAHDDMVLLFFSCLSVRESKYE